MASQRLQKEEQFQSNNYLLEMSCSHIVMQPHFWQKLSYVKIPIFSLARTFESWVKSMPDSQKSFKIRISLRLESLLTSAIICI